MQYYLFDSHYGKFDRYFSAFVCETIKHECLQSKYELKKQSNSKAVQNIHFPSIFSVLKNFPMGIFNIKACYNTKS